MLLFLAAAIELFADWAPEGAPVDQFLPKATEIRQVLSEKGWGLSSFHKKSDNIWVFWNLGPKVKEIDWSSHPKEKRILFIWEPPSVQAELYDPKVQDLFGKIFTWDDDRVDNRRFFKFHYPVLRERLSDLPAFEKKKFCTMIARRLSSSYSNHLYKERENTIRFFEGKPGEFDLYGMYWEKRGYKNWRGPIEDKLSVLKEYKFCICYENTRDIKGYITEKIFDCFAAGVVPVYWGASNISDYIPESCFIDRRKFKTQKQLYRFLKSLSKAQYEKYRESAAAFLKSEQAKVFTPEHFMDTFLKVID